MVHNHEASKAPTPAPANSLPIGTRMHEYEIKAVIGEGGFGIVYLATDTHLGREVAIKEYLPLSHARRLEHNQVQARTPEQQSLFEKGLKSFVAEARVLAQFRSPNLVEVIRFWEGNGTAYFVMPYYQGKTLRELLQKGFRATDQVSLFNLMLPLLRGLEKVHAVGCFHRDISPDNIVVLPDGSPLLLDFGAARHEIIHQTDASTVILKPGFAPIEQYGGQDTLEQQGPWTDIYALSAVGYQLITGVMPPTSVARIMRDPLTPLAGQAASLSLPLTVLKAIDAGLQVQPQDRPQSIAAFRAMLVQKEPALAAESDEARVHQQPLEAAALAAQTAQPAAQGTAAPLAVAAQAAGSRPMDKRLLWAGAIALPIILLLILFVFWRGPAPSPAVDANPTPTQLPPDPINPVDGGTPVIGPQVGYAPDPDSPLPTGTPSIVMPLGDPGNAGTAPAPAGVEGQVHTGSSLNGDETLMSNPDQPNLFGGVQPEPLIPDDTEAPIPTVGFVQVQAQPWGDVYLNGVLVGTTPPSLRLEVPIGSNTIEVRNDSAPALVRNFTIQGGQTERINHNFSAR